MSIRFWLILRLITATLLLNSATLAVANIGSVTETKGSGQVVRKQAVQPVTAQLPIQKMDTVRTGNGRVKITFVDKTTVNVTEQSKLVIDDFVYSGNPLTSKMSLKFASGTVRFATGTGINKSNVNLKTPSATIAVRGTDFTSTVDEFGRSLIILLPEEDGSVGEITVSNAAGEVILNRAFQATMVQNFDTRPSKPVILNLSIDMIDNMMIVNPPKEIERGDETGDPRYNLLDLSELDVDFLQNRDLDRDYFASDELDKDVLGANFLEDYLQDANELSGERDGMRIEGTSFGFNETTQIYAIIGVDVINISRYVGSSLSINVPKDEGKNITINQNNVIHNLRINGGGTEIFIKQTN
jgi:hypothetical protein